MISNIQKKMITNIFNNFLNISTKFHKIFQKNIAEDFT